MAFERKSISFGTKIRGWTPNFREYAACCPFEAIYALFARASRTPATKGHLGLASGSDWANLVCSRRVDV